MEPESNQPSSVSVSFSKPLLPPQWGQVIPAGRKSAGSLSNQALEPSLPNISEMAAMVSSVTTGLPQSLQYTTGMGRPHRRWREMHQSARSRIMLFMRSMPQPGTQRTSSQAAQASSLNASTEQNHWGVARKMMGCLQRQQWG